MIPDEFDSMDVTPEMVLRDALELIKKEPPSKAFIILLYDEPEGQYSRHWLNAGMKTSEVISLLEIQKHEMLNLVNRDIG